jgi:hypothetical protein
MQRLSNAVAVEAGGQQEQRGHGAKRKQQAPAGDQPAIAGTPASRGANEENCNLKKRSQP